MNQNTHEEDNVISVLESDKEARRVQMEREFSFEGYKYVRGELFANLRDPAITIRNGNITFNTACINGFEEVVYINLLINEDLKRLLVRSCHENDKDALRWCVAKPDKRKSRRMRCPDFTNLVYKEMGWDKNCRYKLLGFKITVDGETMYVFDFSIPKVYREMSRKKKGENSDQSISAQTGSAGDYEQLELQMQNGDGSQDQSGGQSQADGQSLQKPDRKGFFPADIANTFGVSVEEHEKLTEVSTLDGYISVGAISGGQKTVNKGNVGNAVGKVEADEVAGGGDDSGANISNVGSTGDGNAGDGNAGE